jgi:gentisate 1,2-dioxygenase
MLEADFEKLYKEMDRNHLQPLWTEERAIVPVQPHSRAVPWLWKGSRLFDFARRAGDLVTLERGGDRRAMGLSNPGLAAFPMLRRPYGPPFSG